MICDLEYEGWLFYALLKRKCDPSLTIAKLKKKWIIGYPDAGETIGLQHELASRGFDCVNDNIDNERAG